MKKVAKIMEKLNWFIGTKPQYVAGSMKIFVSIDPVHIYVQEPLGGECEYYEIDLRYYFENLDYEYYLNCVGLTMHKRKKDKYVFIENFEPHFLRAACLSWHFKEGLPLEMEHARRHCERLAYAFRLAIEDFFDANRWELEKDLIEYFSR